MRPPDVTDRSRERVVIDRLDAIARRLRVKHLMLAAGAGVTFAAAAVVVLRAAGVQPSSVTVSALAAGVLVAVAVGRRLSAQWTPANAAHLCEGRYPESRNVIVTAEELTRHPERARPWIRTRVAAGAATVVEAASVSDVVPMRRAALASAAAMALFLAVMAGVPERVVSMARTADRLATDTGAAGGRAPDMTATIAPPEYLGGQSHTLRNPERIEAVAGSRLTIAVGGASIAWSIRFGTELLPTTTDAEGGLLAEIVLGNSSYLAIEQPGAPGVGRSLIPVVVQADRPPAIAIERPGRDLLLPDARSDVQVAVSATDDFALASLELRFTRVSGSGEQYEFEEGTIPLALDRASTRTWKGRAALALSRMALQPGDALVYRAVGRDGRPGDAGLATSETFFVEIAGPGQVALSGFELPPEQERYALSQQMIVLKIERIGARERSMARADLAREVADIAAEQRAVRAHFIFLTGGHVEDEEREAEHSHEIQEGRLAHSARREIDSAIQFMSRAEQALVEVDTAGALPPARAAVEALQRAFGRNRYFLRTMPVRSRIDSSRRLSGSLEGAGDSVRAAHQAAVDPAADTARRLFAELLAAVSAVSGEVDLDARSFGAMAEQALGVDPGSKEWQQIAAALTQIRDAVAERRPRAEIDTGLGRALAMLGPEAEKHAVAAAPVDRRNAALRGAWAGEKRDP